MHTKGFFKASGLWLLTNSEFFQLCPAQKGNFSSRLLHTNTALQHAGGDQSLWGVEFSQWNTTQTFRYHGPEVLPWPQGLTHRGQNGRQHRAVYPTLEWIDLGSKPILPPPTNTVTFIFMETTFLHLLNQGKQFVIHRVAMRWCIKCI